MSLQEDRAREKLYEAVQEYQQTDLTLRQVVGLLCTEWSEAAHDLARDRDREVKTVMHMLSRPGESP